MNAAGRGEKRGVVPLISLGLQITRFGLVGGVATLTHAVVYGLAIATHLLDPLAANTLAYLCALGVSFIGHRQWTFAPPKRDVPERSYATGALLRFAVVSLIGYALNSLAVAYIVEVLALDPMYALVAMVTLVPAVVFLLSRFWAFRVTA